MNPLHDWLFHFNTYTNLWEGTKRDYVHELFSNSKSPNIIRSKDHDVLVALIEKYDGDIDRINKLFKK